MPIHTEWHRCVSLFEESILEELTFFGEYEEPDVVLDAMNIIDIGSLAVRLKDVGSFGDLFWGGLEDNPELDGYVKRFRRALADHGMAFDKKRFSPHITFVRKIF